MYFADTCYYAGFPVTKEYPTIHSSMHLTNKPSSIHPFNHPSILLFNKHLLNSYAAILSIVSEVTEMNQKHSCSQDTLCLGKGLSLCTPHCNVSCWKARVLSHQCHSQIIYNEAWYKVLPRYI